MNRSEILKQTVKSAGEVVKKAIPTEGVIEKEGHGNFVTAADLASEKLIIDTIRTNYPNDSILAEETESKLADILSIPRLWVVDPIDGTNNFKYQRNYSAVSVGYVESGTVIAGAVYDPFREELYYAERGKGAFVNDKKIHVGDKTDIEKITMGTDNSYIGNETVENWEIIRKLPRIPYILMRGSAVLGFVDAASGRFDLYLHSFLRPWDNAAAFLIIEEAGGIVRGHKGEEISFLSPKIIAGNPVLVEQFVAAIKR